MREPVRDRLRLIHIIEACDRITDYFPDGVIPDLDDKRMDYFGLVKNLEIIGEAAYKLTHEFVDTHPATDWRSIIGMCHLMVHGYYQINPRIVKEIIESEIGKLRKEEEEYLNEISDD